MPGPFDELEKEAERLEKQSKEEFVKKNFVSAISFLEEAQEMYAKLGFQGKIGMINKRIAQLKNLIKHEKSVSVVIQKPPNKVLKQKETDIILSEQKMVPPEIKRKLEQVAMLLQKAEKEEKLGKFSRVIGRYEYILEIYKSISKQILNLSNEIYKIEKKLSNLRSQ